MFKNNKNKQKQFDVVALGELLIDFIDNNKSSQGNPMFEANPGGAPCNLLAMAQKLKKNTAFIGKVGKDQFGFMLKKTLDTIEINTDGLVFDEDVNTTLAFVHRTEDGERDFSFYRNPGADMMLRKSEIREEIICDSKIFHFGTLSMTHTTVEMATKKAIEIAKKEKLLISFDPNLRKPLWNSLDMAKDKILYGISQTDILKIADDELEFITGMTDIDKSIELLNKNYDLKLICVTLGKEGSIAFCNNHRVHVPAYINPATIDTTGAGDTFWGCVLNYILENLYDEDNGSWKGFQLSQTQLADMLRFSNAASSIITSRKGALNVMPNKEEILDTIQNG